MSKDIFLNLSSHDIELVDYDLSLVTGIDYLRQKVKVKLMFFWKEWFLDTTKGMDVYGTIFIKNPNLNIIDNMIKITVSDIEGILNFLEYNSDFDTAQRKLTISFKVNTVYGELSYQQELVL